MAVRPRVIPILLLSSERLVKTVKFANPRYVGDPVNAVRIFNEKGVDEIIIADIEASASKKMPQFDLISELASECFMPLSYSGGVTSLECARRLFASGVEKVCLGSAAMSTPSLISEIAREVGSQSVAVSIDTKKSWLGKRTLFARGEVKPPRLSVAEYAKHVVELGAGEIVLTSIDHEGGQNGMDVELISEVSNAVNVPIIAHGGAGSMEHIQQALSAGASGVAAGSLFVFYGKMKAVLITYPSETEIEHLTGPHLASSC